MPKRFFLILIRIDVDGIIERITECKRRNKATKKYFESHLLTGA